jgi:hypothetical protein
LQYRIGPLISVRIVISGKGDEEDATAPLRESELLSLQSRVSRGVPHLTEALHNPWTDRGEPSDVLKYDCTGLKAVQCLEYMTVERGARILLTSLPIRSAERLAWNAS